MPDSPNNRESTASDNASDLFVAQLMEHRHRIYSFIAKQLVNPADAEDVFQKTSIVLWKKMQDFDAEGSFFHWACGIAFNEVRNFLTVQRRSRLHFDVELVELLAEEAKCEGELSESRLSALRHCMENLAARQQEILRRSYMGTSTITEVAEELGRERGALYKQLARLKEKLIDCIRVRLAQEGVG
ncbi:ECF RNA polymerase sigma-E factor [Anatilimnocola aggregata]|uniref:ECF RNA polymerase sigma-E factor n=1 Tax=Anatilimnocola aggregata TaxID=2528021 RepID=A0A517YGD3_9BACT|nr:sigma-70 family RNA polymerase sigma factor [Anatilimnocola aggregata]QDU29252.1 ECF RNA polymerase sigma-E factor [Anatilimnocola aggregata]